MADLSNMKTQAQTKVSTSELISRRNKLAKEYYALNYPNMTFEQATAEADFWCAYLVSKFHKPHITGQVS